MKHVYKDIDLMKNHFPGPPDIGNKVLRNLDSFRSFFHGITEKSAPEQKVSAYAAIPYETISPKNPRVGLLFDTKNHIEKVEEPYMERERTVMRVAPKTEILFDGESSSLPYWFLPEEAYKPNNILRTANFNTNNLQIVFSNVSIVVTARLNNGKILAGDEINPSVNYGTFGYSYNNIPFIGAGHTWTVKDVTDMADPLSGEKHVVEIYKSMRGHSNVCVGDLRDLLQSDSDILMSQKTKLYGFNKDLRHPLGIPVNNNIFVPGESGLMKELLGDSYHNITHVFSSTSDLPTHKAWSGRMFPVVGLSDIITNSDSSKYLEHGGKKIFIYHPDLLLYFASNLPAVSGVSSRQLSLFYEKSLSPEIIVKEIGLDHDRERYKEGVFTIDLVDSFIEKINDYFEKAIQKGNITPLVQSDPWDHLYYAIAKELKIPEVLGAEKILRKLKDEQEYWSYKAVYLQTLVLTLLELTNYGANGEAENSRDLNSIFSVPHKGKAITGVLLDLSTIGRPKINDSIDKSTRLVLSVGF